MSGIYSHTLRKLLERHASDVNATLPEFVKAVQAVMNGMFGKFLTEAQVLQEAQARIRYERFREGVIQISEALAKETVRDADLKAESLLTPEGEFFGVETK